MIYLKWAEEAAQNAVELSEESEILLTNGRKARSYYLAHMATEEASKAILLKAIVLLNTPEIELKKVDALLRNHRKKIEFLINITETNSSKIAHEISCFKNDLIRHINNQKNNTMYVSMINNKIVTPSSKIENIDVNHHVCFSKKLSTYAIQIEL